MNFKRLIKKVSKEFPELFCFGNYLVFKNCGLILSGIALEKTGSGIYLYKFLYPMYDIKQDVNLLYSERLETHRFYIDLSEVKAELLETELKIRIKDALKVIPREVSVEDFVSILSLRRGLAQHSHAQMVCGLSLLLLGREREANSIFESSKNSFHPSIAKECVDFIEVARNSVDEAKKLLLRNEISFKAKYQIK